VTCFFWHRFLLIVLRRHVDYSLKSPYGGGRPGRVKRKRAKAAAGGEGEDGEAAEEDDE